MKQMLRLLDLQMHSLAAHFDLGDKASRTKSAKALANFFFEIVRFLVPPLFIEAGAADAKTSMRARRYLTDSRIVAFEANPHVFERFKGSVRNVEYYNLALSDKPGTLPFLIQKTIKASADQHSLLARTTQPKCETLAVEATSLDVFFGRSVPEPCCIWIDVEGSTGQVLSGAKETLQHVAALIVEVEDRPVWNRQWLRPQVSEFLLEAGFLPVARDFQSRYQYNLIFAKEALIEYDRFRNALAYFHSRLGGFGMSKAPTS